MKRKFASVTAVALASVLALAACSSGSGDTAGGDASTVSGAVKG